MGRIYTAQFTDVSVSVVQELFEITTDSNTVVKVHKFGFFQTSDFGDIEEEGLLIVMKSGQNNSGSGGSVVVPVPLSSGDPLFLGVVEANNTTIAAAGTIVTHYAWGWNIRMPFEEIFTPECQPEISPGERLTFELLNAPADPITMSGHIVFEEMGG